MVLISRLIAALAYAGAAFLFGMALGERGELGPVQFIFAIVIPVAAIVLAFFAKQGRGYVFFTGMAMFAGLLLGQHQFENAFADCRARATEVRAALIAFHERRDGYPSRLEELEMKIPCRAGLRKTILHYLSNERGFRLWYTNDRETVILTASEKSSTPRTR